MAQARDERAAITTSLQPRLREILDDVNGWLRFAEAKNGALAAAVLAGIFGLGQFDVEFTKLGWISLTYFGSALAFGLVSAAISVASFSPQIRVPWLYGIGSPNATDNLLYFGDIAKYKPPAFLAALRVCVGGDGHEPTAFDRAYAEQIVTNSRITVRKFKSFEVAVWLTLAGLITPILAVLLYMLEKRRHQEDETR